MKAIHTQNRTCKRQIALLYSRVDDLIEKRSVKVNEDLNNHLVDITEQ